MQTIYVVTSSPELGGCPGYFGVKIFEIKPTARQVFDAMTELGGWICSIGWLYEITDTNIRKVGLRELEGL